MNLAYIILTHKFANHLARLIQSLANENDHFFVHVDNKIHLDDFVYVLKKVKANVHIVKKRENGQWGDLGIVQATINALHEIKQSETAFDRVVLLSGQDYPIKSMEYIRNFFTAHPDNDYITYEPFPVNSLNYGGMDRIQHYSINFGGKRYTYLPFKYCKNLNLKGRIINSFMWLFQVVSPKRKFVKDIKPYYGSQWWNLTMHSVDVILEYLANNPKYLKYHKYTLLPDEIFFQSILLKCKSTGRIENDNLRYIRWDESGNHPDNLNTEDLNNLLNSNAMFARKFVENSPILDDIDKHIHN